MNGFLLFAFFCFVIHEATPFQWAQEPRDGSILYACAGETVNFPWNFTLSEGEILEDVQWFYQENLSSGMRMLAVMTNGAFLPVPSFARRVAHDTNYAAITFKHVVTGDTGNYTVVVSGRESSGSFFQYRRTVLLQVGADLMTTDTELHVHENPVAVLDTVTKQWSVELLCGTFTYFGVPPFNVEWLSPTMAILNNSRYENGQFKLSLTQPIQGGKYTCRIPIPLIHSACLPGNASFKGQATYDLDEMSARLTLLEAHQNALQKENDVLKTENSALRIRDFDLNDRVNKLEALTYKRVSFHAHGLRNTHPHQGSALIVDNVVINQGDGYNRSTGTFTAPVNGTYFFMGTTGSWTTSQTSQFSLTVDGQVIAYVSTRTNGPVDAVSVHGIVHLSVGQQVWLRISSSVEFSSAATSFSGYLISPDP